MSFAQSCSDASRLHRQSPTPSRSSRRCSRVPSTTRPSTASTIFLEPQHSMIRCRRYEKSAQLIRSANRRPAHHQELYQEHDSRRHHVDDMSGASLRGDDHNQCRGLRSTITTFDQPQPDQHRQDMVQHAYEAPVHMAPRAQIEDAERAFSSLPAAASTPAFWLRRKREGSNRNARQRLQARPSLGLPTGLEDVDRRWEAAELRPRVCGARHGQTALPQIATTSPALARRAQAEAPSDCGRWHSSALLAGNVGGGSSHASMAEQGASPLRHPPRRHPRGPVRPDVSGAGMQKYRYI